jgi:hypothetical protein
VPPLVAIETKGQAVLMVKLIAAVDYRDLVVDLVAVLGAIVADVIIPFEYEVPKFIPKNLLRSVFHIECIAVVVAAPFPFVAIERYSA